jgi:hypothetical protein
MMRRVKGSLRARCSPRHRRAACPVMPLFRGWSSCLGQRPAEGFVPPVQVACGFLAQGPRHGPRLYLPARQRAMLMS